MVYVTDISELRNAYRSSGPKYVMLSLSSVNYSILILYYFDNNNYINL